MFVGKPGYEHCQNFIRDRKASEETHVVWVSSSVLVRGDSCISRHWNRDDSECDFKKGGAIGWED